jgi:hypothetical protein
MSALSEALKQLKAQRQGAERELDRVNAAIRALQGVSGKGKPAAKRGRKRRKLSAAVRARIAAFQRARWAKIRAQQGKK